MPKNKCFICGSSNFRADRSLSGRLVCNSCGTPYGVRKGRRKKINSFIPFSYKDKLWLFIFIIIFIFILFII
tara:strand:- start:663 stop:878 length:216 start_codon:yes stop_codon:yes gene_type:complete